ncbi:MAG: hypothetical protein DLM58_10565 [Pseudonocardiales bacterium]|nr:MAG: hypothetical protein DLM58_10565 [Pseudonocardiales bacterium]
MDALDDQHDPHHQDDDTDGSHEQSATRVRHQPGRQAARLGGLTLVPTPEDDERGDGERRVRDSAEQ